MINDQNVWVSSFHAKNNKKINVRHVLPGDERYFIDIFEHMSEESRYQRFNQTHNNLSLQRKNTEAHQMIEVTTHNGSGLIAFMEEDEETVNGRTTAVPVAVARYVKMDEDTAEAAMSVRDDMHGQGIGSILFRQLVEEAKRNGIKTLVGMMQNSNTAMWVIFDRLPYPVKRIPDGTVSDIEIDLTQFKT